MYLNVYQPRLQTERGVAAFFRFHRGETFASSALMDPISKAFIAAVERFVQQEQVPLITFAKGQRKDDVAQEYRSQYRGTEGILFVGKAQEKTPVFRTEKRRNPDTGQTYPWIVRSTAMVNHFYFYGADEDFGPFFIREVNGEVNGDIRQFAGKSGNGEVNGERSMGRVARGDCSPRAPADPDVRISRIWLVMSRTRSETAHGVDRDRRREREPLQKPVEVIPG